MSNILKTGGIGFQTDALLAPEQALTLYFARAGVAAPTVESVALGRALGRILAQPICADADYPAAARSAMDGFAVRAAETPGRLAIAGEIRMGHTWPTPLARGQAVRIPTGGVLPNEADAVVPIENAAVSGDFVEIGDAVPVGDCVTPAASDMREGELLIDRGTRIAAAQLGVLATLGIASVPVYRQPSIAMISSGDELVDVRTVPEPGQIRDSNRWAVGGALEAMGARVMHMPTAADDRLQLEALVAQALRDCDGVVLTGGSSVGERDLTPQIVHALGEPGVIVHGLRVKPGKPTVLASIGGKPVLGLPGNPVSALMVLEAVAAPIVGCMTGENRRAHTIVARLGASYRKRLGWTWFVPVRLNEAEETPTAYPLELRSSSVSLLARAGGFTIMDEALETPQAGEQVLVRRFIGS